MSGCFGNSFEDKVKEIESLEENSNEVQFPECEVCDKSFTWFESTSKINDRFCSLQCEFEYELDN